jgi:hypothetical protein
METGHSQDLEGNKTMDIKWLLKQVLDDVEKHGGSGVDVVQLCRDALAEIDRLEERPGMIAMTITLTARQMKGLERTLRSVDMNHCDADDPMLELNAICQALKTYSW